MTEWFHPKRPYLIAASLLGAGAVVPLGFAPFGLYLLVWPSLAWLFFCWHTATPRRAMAYGGLFGLGWFLVGVSWIYVAIHEFGHTPPLLAALFTLLFVGWLALYPLLMGGGGVYLRRWAGLEISSPLWLGGLLPLIWTFGEWVRGWLLSGFPWLNLGFSQIDSYLSGWAPILGVHGVNLLLSLCVGWSVWWWCYGRQRRWPSTVVIGSLLLLVIGGGAILSQISWSQPAAEALPVALVQGNTEQQTKWVAGAAQQRMDRYRTLTEQLDGESRIVVWPENAITVFHHQVRQGYIDPLAASLARNGTELILGIPVQSTGGRYYTTMVVARGDQPYYAKRHLVPFGEYLPLESLLRGVIELFNLPMSGFTVGPQGQGPLTIAGQQAAISICYEDLFAEELIGQLQRGATLVINGSNNGWYGDSLAPHQHLQIARMFSLVTARPTLRATTNGISAIIDHRGEVVAHSKQFDIDVVTGVVVPQRGLTPFSRWGNGLLLLVLFIGLTLILVGGRYRRVRHIPVDVA